MDRLSVRTEVSSNPNLTSTNIASRKPLSLPEDESAIDLNTNNLYFSPVDSADNRELALANVAQSKEIKTKSIQESILRHMNREMTPTISEVYHERNLGLGLAPPLSKLLLNSNYEDSEKKIINQNIGSLADAVKDLEITSNIQSSALSGSCDDLTSSVNTIAKPGHSKKPTSKPWLSNITANILKAGDLTTADNILERQNKIKAASMDIQQSSSTTTSTMIKNRNGSPFSELSRRDEGDGRSVADSQCSGNFKTDINNSQSRSKFNLDT